MNSTPTVLIVAGYFDWFSGYQEVGLARAMRQFANVKVLASDWVSPIFSDSHISSLGVPRRYAAGVREEEGVMLKRLTSAQCRAMVWSPRAVSAVMSSGADHIVQVMPGQILPVAASLAFTKAPRSVLYGDNSAMYARLPPAVAAAKFAVFTVAKGSLYRFVNSRAQSVHGYTPETLTRLQPFNAGRTMSLLPLAFDDTIFKWDPQLRGKTRAHHGWQTDEFVVIAPGKAQPQKRLDVLIEAVSGLRREGHKVRLVLVGLDGGKASASLRAHIERLQADTYIDAFGFVPAKGLNALFNAADLGVWPTMPAITIQQSMGTGLRVLIPDNDLVSHLVPAAASGQRFTPGSDLKRTLMSAVKQEFTRVPELSREHRRESNEWLSTTSLARELLRTDASVSEHVSSAEILAAPTV